MPVQTLRIVDSDPEASLNPRAIWKHWKEKVLWDHRTYYASLEFIAGLVLTLGLVQYPPFYQDSVLNIMQRLVEPLLVLSGIIPIHWYSNQRNSNHALTKARSHLLILASLTVTLFVCQVLAFFLPSECINRRWGCNDEVKRNINLLLWLAIAISVASLYVVYNVARNPIKDPLLAELPSPISIEDEATFAWAGANVADGIEDDPVELEGQVRL